MSQSSVAMQRHSVLSQEKGCAAAGDIVAISFVGPYSWLQTGAGGQQDHDFMSHLLVRTRHHLEELNGVLEIRLVDVEYLGGERNFHAEKSATQQIYHYLLPLAWLKDGKELEKWWLAENQEVQEIEDGLMIQNGTIGAQSYAAFKSEPPTDSLKLLRNALKKAESVFVPNRRVRRRLLLQNQSQLPENSILSNTGQWQNSKREISKVASRKLGTVTNRERRAWHNFADPELKGQASPNHEPVWRVLDRARICNFLKVPHEIEIVAVLEFRGDDFVPQQVRRIVGTTLAVNHGWLPDDIFDLATSAESFMDTVLAPSGRLYLNGVRFHFDEDGIDILQHDSKPGLITNSTCNWLSTRLLLNKGTKDEKMKEMAWLNEVETQSAPQILLQVNTASGYSSTGYTDSNKALPLQASPAHYSQVLKLLRKIVQSRTWPDTSIARSKIIRGQTNGNDEENKDKFGSFTVVNPKAQNGSFDLPLANLYFSDLVDAVFDLEKMLTNQLIKRANTDGSVGVEKSDRISSSHCAVNFNAQFTPHVDSGRGLGQSLSMIVGLGDYNEGEIYVEGVPHQIRYQPLEFDGWGLRHWTNHYRGERFSLVFFTPET
jgi:tRNA U38,U39,U40 pseudouridine synthase TruA